MSRRAPFGGGSSAPTPIVGTYATITGTASPLTGTLGFPTDGGRQQIYDGSAWRPIINGTVGKEPPAAGSFTAYNSGTISKSNGILKITNGASGYSGGGIQYSSSGLGASTYVIARIQPLQGNDLYTATSKWTYAGVYIREVGAGSAGKLAVTYLANSLDVSSKSYAAAGIGKMSAPGTTVDSTFYPQTFNGPVWLRVRVNSGNIAHEISMDRLTWIALPATTSAAATNYFTTTGSGNYEYGVAVWSATAGGIAMVDDLEQG